jgi:hypothetical protein
MSWALCRPSDASPPRPIRPLPIMSGRGCFPTLKSPIGESRYSLNADTPVVCKCRYACYLKKDPAPPFSISEVWSCSTSRAGGTVAVPSSSGSSLQASKARIPPASPSQPHSACTPRQFSEAQAWGRRAENSSGHQRSGSAAMPRVTTCLVVDRLRVGACKTPHDPTKAEKYAKYHRL